MTSQSANRTDLATKTHGSDSMKWMETAKVVLNGKQVDVSIPDGTSRYLKLQPLKPVEGGYSYKVVFLNGPAEQNGYRELPKTEDAILPGETYRIPDAVTKLHLRREY